MATITTSNLATLLPPVGLKPRAQSSPVLGLPVMGGRGGRVRCSMEKKAEGKSQGKDKSMVGSIVAAAAAAMGGAAGPAMALVDERMSTEGTGLPFGLSNNLLGWILFGVFGLIWSLYTIYTSTLDEDDDSALSL